MYRLVIVDDEPHILEGLKNLYPWENLGFEVTATFQNGRDALDYINTHGHIDVVMTDIQMPVLSGVELAQNLRDSNTIVIFFSAYQDFAYARAAIINHVVDYLIKQFKEISDVITNRSLLLMNESIQSTTPKECVDIAVSLVHIFCILGVRGVFATHLVDIAPRALELNTDNEMNTGVESITVSVDESTGERLYKIKKGLPGDSSYADTIFEKFGLDLQALKKRAKQMNS